MARVAFPNERPDGRKLWPRWLLPLSTTQTPGGPSSTVRAHHLVDEALERLDASLGLAAAKSPVARPRRPGIAVPRPGRTRLARMARPGADPSVAWQRSRAWREVFRPRRSRNLVSQKLSFPVPGVQVKDAPALPRSRGHEGSPRPGLHGFMASSESQHHTVVPDISATTPRPTILAPMSGTWKRDKGTPSGWAARKPAPLRRRLPRGKRPAAGRRGRSSRPARPARKSVFAIWRRPRRVSRRAAISSLPIPVAANSTILARTTSLYGNVYRRQAPRAHDAARQ